MNAAPPAAPASGSASSSAAGGSPAWTRSLPAWWPLAALTLLAAVLRLSTLDLQSFWYDEAFTPIHVLHPSLWATLRSVVHTENSPPLWYLLAWADSRVLGTGEIALRLPSALAGIATVPVAWAIGRELEGRAAQSRLTRRAALICAALVAVNPLFVWYSQEARVYGLFVLTAALAMLIFLRAERDPTPRRMAAFAAAGALVLLTHYFAVFLLAPTMLWLLLGRRAERRQAGSCARAGFRAALAACGAIVAVGVALLPLIAAQGGHGTQWIGRWPLSERLQAIPQYFLTGYSGLPLGRGIELLVALPILAGVGLWLWRWLEQPAAVRARNAAADPAGAEQAASERRGALIALSIAACGVLTPVVLAVFGADYLAPRNLVAAMIPVTALIAVLLASPSTGRVGVALALTVVLAFGAISLDVDLSPRLQRGNWRDVARALRADGRPRAITTVELGAAPLEYYLPGLHNLARRTVLVSEIDETGYSPLRASAAEPPAPGFRLLARLNIDGLIIYRFVADAPRAVSEAALRRHVIMLAHPEVLVPAALG
jgi:mannosyltransferase